VAGRQDATPGRARRARAGRPLWGQLASPARVSGGGAQIRAPPPPPRRTGAGQRAEVVVGRRAEVEAGRCAGAGLPPGAGQRARARSRAEEGDGGGEEDGVAEVEAGRAPEQACRARRRGGGPQRGAGLAAPGEAPCTDGSYGPTTAGLGRLSSRTQNCLLTSRGPKMGSWFRSSVGRVFWGPKTLCVTHFCV